ncbi:hypothetical protein [Chryseobacterium sp. P1-3]|uniref:hypothetical protein n=1 Tax=Chryseobacterium sp. (strain P1-3) TaxID=1517683 RepID=UPI000B3085D2|nr:hypothetical protein [Chryseobacterium sp. P1-3]
MLILKHSWTLNKLRLRKKADAGQAKLKQYSEEAPKKTAEENKAREAELQKNSGRNRSNARQSSERLTS